MRKFKLRNGAIVEEAGFTEQEHGKDGYPAWFNVVDYGGMSHSDKREIEIDDTPIRLLLGSGGFPKGGSWGRDLDIVEEIK
jgi:hypothetical protein